jgi:hypothetical protein
MFLSATTVPYGCAEMTRFSHNEPLQPTLVEAPGPVRFVLGAAELVRLGGL